jgi:predicted MPP superfamily phosphohydrolase
MKKVLYSIIFIIILIIIYAFFIEVKLLKVNEINIIEDNIANYDGLKIVHISDVHYGTTIFNKELKRLEKEINKIKPDIILFTGDLIDMKTIINDEVKNNLTNFLTNINALYGKYAVSGNHDINDDYYTLLTNSNFIILNNKYDIIYNENNEKLLLAGINTNEPINIINEIKEEELKYKILMLHEPDYVNEINKEYFNLITSGHSHNNQINIGLKITPKGSRTYYKPHYKFNNTNMYISNGVGTSIIKARLFSVPSINFYRITKK